MGVGVYKQLSLQVGWGGREKNGFLMFECCLVGFSMGKKDTFGNNGNEKGKLGEKGKGK